MQHYEQQKQGQHRSNVMYAPNKQVRQMEINRINNRSVVYIVEDHGTIQDLMVQGTMTTTNTSSASAAVAAFHNQNSSASSRQASKIIARLSGKSNGPSPG